MALEEIRAVYLGIGHNMWCDWVGVDEDASWIKDRAPDRVLRTKDELWRRVTDYAAEQGLNMVVADLGEGIFYPSHPELAIEGTWSVDKIRAEIKRLKDKGIELIPKLNFSTTHNGWLKQYRRLISTSTYYKVCEDVIRDVAEIFDHPRFFHIGCDEEVAGYEDGHVFVCTRKGELWWHDFLHLVKNVEKNGMRCWCWSDFGWHHEEEYLKRCPKSVLQSNWYYDECNEGFVLEQTKEHRHRFQQYTALEKAGFDQVPCGTNWVGHVRRRLKIGADDVIGRLVKYCRETIPQPRLKGFLMAPWAPLDNDQNFEHNRKGIELFGQALKQYVFIDK